MYMKKWLLPVLLLLSLSSAAVTPKQDTVRINTTELARKVYGYADITPVEIVIVDGKILEIKALPNEETPAYFEEVRKSRIFTRLRGMTVEEAKKVELDAISGATYSSLAVIENIRLGLEAASKKQ